MHRRHLHSPEWLTPLAIAVCCAGLPACAPNADAFAKVQEVNAVKAEVQTVKADVAAVKTTVGNIKVGGGADSITAWLYAAIAAAAIFYPAVIRPIRKYLVPDEKT